MSGIWSRVYVAGLMAGFLRRSGRPLVSSADGDVFAMIWSFAGHGLMAVFVSMIWSSFSVDLWSAVVGAWAVVTSWH